MEETKLVNDISDEKLFIRKFIEDKTVWINRDYYVFFNKKKYRIALIVLRKLLELERCSLEKLTIEVKKELDVYIQGVMKKYNNSVSLIKNSEDKGVICRRPNSNEYYVSSFKSAIKGTVRDMTGLLIHKKTIWMTDKSKPPASILTLNRNGRKLALKILERHETSENIVENQ